MAPESLPSFTMFFDATDIATWHLRALVVLAVTLVGAAAMPRATAAARHRVLAFGMLAAVVIPTLAALLPAAMAVEVTAPQAATESVSLLLATSPAASPAASASPAAAVASAAPPAAWSGSLMLVGLWLAGSAFFGLRVAASLWGARGLRRGAVAAPPEIQAIVRQVQAQGSARAEVALNARLSVPIVVGVLRPTILLPEAARDWSERRLQSVLSHELGHIGNGDHHWFPLAHAVRALLWLNPLAWVATHRFKRHAEFSADDAALATGIRASTYATELLALARAVSGTAPLLTSPALGHSDIGIRIRRLLASPAGMVSMRRIVPVALGIAGAAVCVAVIQPTVSLQRAGSDGEQSSPEQTTRGTAAAPPNAWRLRLADGHVAAVLDGHAHVEQSLSDPRLRKSHLLLGLHEGLSSLSPDPSFTARPLVVQADGDVPFGDLVDALYSAGRAEALQSSFGLAVPTQHGERVIPIDVPRYPNDAATTSRQLNVMLSADGQTVRVGVSRPSKGTAACSLDQAGDALRQWTDQLCADLGAEQVVLTVSAANATPYSAVTRAMIAAKASCVHGLVIEAGSASAATLPSAPACGPTSFR